MPLMELLQSCVDRQASALHIKVGLPAVLRVNGELLPLEGPKLTGGDTRALCFEALTEEQGAALEEQGELEGDFVTEGGIRFHWCLFKSKGDVTGVFHNAAVAPAARTETAEEAWAQLPHFALEPHPAAGPAASPAVYPPRWEEPDGDDDFPGAGPGSAPVFAPLLPPKPSRTGRDAKPLPTDTMDPIVLPTNADSWAASRGPRGQ